MTIFDFIILIILAGFVFYGLFFGLVRTLGSFLGFVIGLWLSFISYLIVFDWVKNLFFGHEIAGKIVIFVILFTLINRLICFIFVLIDNAFDLLSIIPFLKTINRLLGAVLGFLMGGLVLGLVLIFISHYGGNINWVSGIINKSKVASFFLQFINILSPLLPGLLVKLKSII